MSFCCNFLIWLVVSWWWVQLSWGTSLLLCSSLIGISLIQLITTPSNITNTELLVIVLIFIGARDRIPANLGGSKPHPSVIFPLLVYKYIQIRIKDKQPVPQVCLFSKRASAHTALVAILVSNLIGPVNSGQHMYWTIRVVTDIIWQSYLLHVN